MWLNILPASLKKAFNYSQLDYFHNKPGLKLLFGDGVFMFGKGEEPGPHHVEKINLKDLL